MGFLRSEEKNQAYPWAMQSFSAPAQSMVSAGQQGLMGVQNFLSGADTSGFDNYRRSSGYQNIFDEAMRGVTGSAAARGLMASGSTLRGLQNRGSQLAQQNYGNYLNQLMGVSQAQLQGGLGLANVITGSGQKSRGGLGQEIGGLASGLGAMAASDPRLKTDIKLVEERPGEPDLYSYRYVGSDEWHVGVMADEVAELRPDALGPVVDGYLTVDYRKL
jgi:hypothetical protein